jgi:hypothetical protein
MNLQQYFDELNEDTGRTSFNGKISHAHIYEADEKGNGKTTKTIGKTLEHVHEIKNNKVVPAGEDSHIHTLPEKK